MANAADSISEHIAALDAAAPAARDLIQALSSRSIALAALRRCLPPEGEAHELGPGISYLENVPQVADDEARAWLHAGAAIDEPAHQRLGAALELNSAERLAIALLQAIDDEPLLAHAVSALQSVELGARPTLGLLAIAFAPVLPAGTSVIELLVGGQALHAGVLALLDPSAALPDRRLALPTPIYLALRGRDGPFPGVEVDRGSLTAHVPLGAELEAALINHALALDAEHGALCVRGGSPVECMAAASVLARTMGKRAAFLDGETASAPGLGAFLTLLDLLPVLSVRMGPGERKRLPALIGYAGPVIALAGPDGAVETGARVMPDLTLPLPSPAERALLWTRALGDAGLAAELAAQHRHGPGRIAQLGRLASHYAALDAAPSIAAAHVHAAAWTIEGGGLGSLAQAQRDHVPDEAFVATPAVREELELLLLRCQSRGGLTAALGPTLQARARAGVRSLFVGPSGTGKTLAASWLATKLGMPLYRIDLASVTSKYIGETEKNLADVLARAEHADVVLLFDEADSLFGRRTEVRDSHDRFANAQTNYLLQRIESYAGIVLLTSNSRTRFDSAFSRRLDAIIEFPLPGPEERRDLWRAHLGTAHRLSAEQQNRLAAAADLAGGAIRNAVLAAAVIASAAKRPIEYADVVLGLSGEYRKLGLSLPPELVERAAPPIATRGS